MRASLRNVTEVQSCNDRMAKRIDHLCGSRAVAMMFCSGLSDTAGRLAIKDASRDCQENLGALE